MERTVLCGLLLFLLPFGTIGVSLHDLVKRDAHGKGAHWNYENDAGPLHWASKFEECRGKRQSPINIVNSEVDLNEDLNDFDFDEYDVPFEDAIMENNGHTIQIRPGPRDGSRSFTEGGLDDEYEFKQLHFHWGSSENKGSEHTIDGQAFEMEMHLVHMKEKYKTMEEALRHEDGLAVLGVMFNQTKEDNPALKPIIEELIKVKKEGEEEKVEGFTLESLLPDDTMPYYRYEGSLTTPPCSEVVVWTIFQEPVNIGYNQLKAFRSITEDDAGEATEQLVNNFRPPQPLNKREVEISGKSNSATSATIYPSIVAVLAALQFLL